MNDTNGTETNSGGAAGSLKTYVTPLMAWALSLGCCVGWGSLVMPGTTFLPLAGPLGTIIGFAVGTLVILIIVFNYRYMMECVPEAGGTYAFARSSFGYDHGFLSAWFLLLTYVAMLWANATALALIARNVFGDYFQVGLHYRLAGFEIYIGEALLSCAAILCFGLICLKGRAAGVLQAVLMLGFCIGVVVCFALVMHGQGGSFRFAEPAYSPDMTPGRGILAIVMLAPWAFVGFESVSHSAEEFGFSQKKKTLKILLAAILSGTAAYILLTLIACSALPEGFSDWPEYIGQIGGLSGIGGLPVFYALQSQAGKAGIAILGVTAMCAIFTSLIGNAIAASRLLYSLAREEMMPPWFGKLNRNGVPEKAVIFIICISFVIPFLGRTAIGWIVDVNTVGATIAYAYTSAATYKTACAGKNRLYRGMGMAGIALSAFFVLYFILGNTLSAESYLILATWSILGFLYFRYVFRRDEKNRMGLSLVVWVVLLGLIIFTSLSWIRQTVRQTTVTVAEELDANYVKELEDAGVERSEEAVQTSTEYLRARMDSISRAMMRNSIIQTMLIVVSLWILFGVYSIMQKRQKKAEMEKLLAEESSRAKTSFLSNMSHEIRTPLNAIIGLDNIALREPDLPPRTMEQLEKIGGSARHLLGLINDILDMSRIESGRMVLKNEEFSFRSFLDQISVIINGQCVDKGLEYVCRIKGRMEEYYVGDDMKLKQVLINILGNSVKFTNPPGSVLLEVEQINRCEDLCTLRFIMADTGIGMDAEYIPRIFEAFSQEDSTATNRYGGSGLGMAITRNLIQMMKGDIDVESVKGEGTTFTFTVTLHASDKEAEYQVSREMLDNLRVLVVDDDPVACEHARLILGEIGASAEVCQHGEDALVMIEERRKANNPYHMVMLDLRMPGINGIELTKKIRESGNTDVAVVMLTGYNWDDVEKEARKAGVEAFLSKPLFTDTVSRVVRNVLESKDVLAAEIVSETVDEEKALDLNGLRVLLAEDVEINAEIMIDLLDMEGILVEHAENGQAAVELFEEREPGWFDAILMDVRMPVMDGLAAAKKIRELGRPDAKTIPIIALTANAFEEDVQQSLQSGMNAHLSKPIEIERLYETLHSLIGKKSDEEA